LCAEGKDGNVERKRPKTDSGIIVIGQIIAIGLPPSTFQTAHIKLETDDPRSVLELDKQSIEKKAAFAVCAEAARQKKEVKAVCIIHVSDPVEQEAIYIKVDCLLISDTQYNDIIEKVENEETKNEVKYDKIHFKVMGLHKPVTADISRDDLERLEVSEKVIYYPASLEA
jgi:hypothetical protein